MSLLVVFCLAMLVVFLWAIKWDLKERAKFALEERFRRHFVFQADVNRRLQELARDLEEIFQKERDKYRTKTDTSEDFDKQVANIKLQIAVFKKSFWEAHNLAKKFGYTVSEKYTDYLPPK